jgi:outer membrane immunogenic protein
MRVTIGARAMIATISGLAIAVLIASGPVAATGLGQLVSGASNSSTEMTWAGFYSGVQLGYDFHHLSYSDASVTETLETSNLILDASRNPINGQGGIVGFQVGYDWQVSSKYLLGVVADYGVTSISGKTCLLNCDSDYASYINTDVKSLGTLRGRVGYFHGSTLYYLTGGAAIAAINGVYGNQVLGGVSRYSADTSMIGYTLGLGLEHRFTHHVSASLDYLHMFFPYQTDEYSHQFEDGRASYAIDSRVEMNVVRASLNYRF